MCPAFLAEVLGGKKSPLGHMCLPPRAADATSAFSEGGWVRSGQGWPRAWGWPSAGAGQAGMRRPGRPQLLPQVLAPLAAGKGELIFELRPKQRRLLAPAGGSSASWGPVLALLLACSTTWDKLFGPRSLDWALPRRVEVGGCPQLATREQSLSTWPASTPWSCVYYLVSLCAGSRRRTGVSLEGKGPVDLFQGPKWQRLAGELAYYSTETGETCSVWGTLGEMEGERRGAGELLELVRGKAEGWRRSPVLNEQEAVRDFIIQEGERQRNGVVRSGVLGGQTARNPGSVLS